MASALSDIFSHLSISGHASKPPENNKKSYPKLTQLAIGVFAGTCDILATHPFFLIKTRLQTKSPAGLFSNLYREFLPDLLNVAPASGIQVLSDDYIKKGLSKSVSIPIHLSLSSAFLSGVISAAFSTPVELIISLQDKHKMSAAKAFGLFFSPYRLHHLETGYINTALRDGICAAATLALVPALKKPLEKHISNDLAATTLSGLFSGMIAAILTNPPDAIKTHQQDHIVRAIFPSSEALNGCEKTITMAQAVKDLGFRGLFLTGLFPRGAMISLSVTIQGVVIHYLKEYFSEDSHKP